MGAHSLKYVFHSLPYSYCRAMSLPYSYWLTMNEKLKKEKHRKAAAKERQDLGKGFTVPTARGWSMKEQSQPSAASSPPVGVSSDRRPVTNLLVQFVREITDGDGRDVERRQDKRREEEEEGGDDDDDEEER